MRKIICVIALCMGLLAPLFGETSQLEKKLAQHISVDFVATPFSKVIQFLQDKTKIVVEYHKAVTNMQKVKDWIEQLANDNLRIREQAKKNLLKAAIDPQVLALLQSTQKSHADIQVRWYLDQICRELRKAQGQAQQEALITAKLKDVKIYSLLDLITYYQNLSWKIADNKIVIRPCTKGEQSLAEFLKQTYQNNARYPLLPYPFGTPQWYKVILHKLQTQKVTFNFKDTPLLDALQVIHQVTQINIFVTPTTTRRLLAKKRKTTLAVKEHNLQNSLKLLLALNHCKFIVTSEALVIGERHLCVPLTDQVAAKIQKVSADFSPQFMALQSKRRAEINATRKQLLSCKVNEEFLQTPLPEVLKVLQAKTKINFILDSQVSKELPPLTFESNNLILQDFLHTVLARYNLDYRLEPGVVIIITKEQAQMPHRVTDAALVKARYSPLQLPAGANVGQVVLTLMEHFGRDVYIDEQAWQTLAKVHWPQQKWLAEDFLNFLMQKLQLWVQFRGQELYLIHKRKK